MPRLHPCNGLVVGVFKEASINQYKCVFLKQHQKKAKVPSGVLLAGLNYAQIEFVGKMPSSMQSEFADNIRQKVNVCIVKNTEVPEEGCFALALSSDYGNKIIQTDDRNNDENETKYQTLDFSNSGWRDELHKLF